MRIESERGLVGRRDIIEIRSLKGMKGRETSQRILQGLVVVS